MGDLPACLWPLLFIYDYLLWLRSLQPASAITAAPEIPLTKERHTFAKFGNLCFLVKQRERHWVLELNSFSHNSKTESILIYKTECDFSYRKRILTALFESFNIMLFSEEYAL